MEQEMDQSYDFAVVVMAIVAILLLVFIITLWFLSNVYYPFVNKRRYLKMEMNRSEGEEYEHWKRRLRRHYIRHIPFIGNLILRFKR